MRTPLSSLFLFLTPFYMVFFMFLFFPFIYAFYLSFNEVTQIRDILSSLNFVGVKNYIQLLKDKAFVWSIIASFIYASLYIPMNLLASLGGALLLRGENFTEKFLRTLIFMPFVLDTFVVGIVWNFILAPHYGPVSNLLSLFGFPKSITLLGNTITVMPSISLVMVLKNFGLGVILLTSTLLSIPRELEEAALIDGAGKFKRFIYVILPQLKHIIIFIAITSLIGCLSAFSEFFALTGGGPSLKFMGTTVGFTKVTGLFLFDHFQQLNMGYAASASFLILLLVLILTIIGLKLTRE